MFKSTFPTLILLYLKVHFKLLFRYVQKLILNFYFVIIQISDFTTNVRFQQRTVLGTSKRLPRLQICGHLFAQLSQRRGVRVYVQHLLLHQRGDGNFLDFLSDLVWHLYRGLH